MFVNIHLQENYTWNTEQLWNDEVLRFAAEPSEVRSTLYPLGLLLLCPRREGVNYCQGVTSVPYEQLASWQQLALATTCDSMKWCPPIARLQLSMHGRFMDIETC